MTKTRLRIITLLWASCTMMGAVERGRPLGERLQTMGIVHAAFHTSVFAVLGLLLMLSFDTQQARLVAIVAGITLGFATEFYEHAAFHNAMEYGDVFIDGLGVLAGAAVRLVRRPSMI
jgi:hypothetical protein